MKLTKSHASPLRAMRGERRPSPGEAEEFSCASLGNGSLYLRWPGLFEMTVSGDGKRIAGRALNGAPRESFLGYLLSQILSFALLKQGIEPLHATTVTINGGAIGFMGDCGYGKSTLGAAFLQAGFPLLTDDLLVLKDEGDAFVAHPGPQRIKLLPETAKGLLGTHVRGTAMNRIGRKLIIPLDEQQCCPNPAALQRLYVLAPPSNGNGAKRVRIRTLSPRKAFLELTRNTFNAVVTEPKRLERQFRHAAAVASRIPVKSLCYPWGLNVLPAVREAILADLGR